MYFIGYLGGGGSDVFCWSFFALEVIASGGGGEAPQTPSIPYLSCHSFGIIWAT